MPPPWLRGIAFDPTGELYSVDFANRSLERHVFDERTEMYTVLGTKTFRGRPLAVTYMSVKTGFDFDGVVVTLDTRNIRFISCPYLEIRRTVYSYGRCTAIAAVPDTQSLLVVNSETSSVDVINIYGVPMKRFDLPEVLNPNRNPSLPASVCLSTIGDREMVVIASESGLYVMTVDVDKTKTLILTPRQTLARSETFCPMGLCSIQDQVFVANGAESDYKIHRFRLALRNKPPEDVIMVENGTIDESAPTALSIIKLEDGVVRLGVARSHDNPAGDELLSHRQIMINDKS